MRPCCQKNRRLHRRQGHSSSENFARAQTDSLPMMEAVPGPKVDGLALATRSKGVFRARPANLSVAGTILQIIRRFRETTRRPC
jgi:hypothetical protein